MKRVLPYKMKTLFPLRYFRAGQVLLLLLLTAGPLQTARAGVVPVNILLSSNEVHENNVVGIVIGTFSADADAGPCTFSFATGQGDADNKYFSISGNKLKALIVFDYETRHTYSIRVKCTDTAGNTLEKAFQVEVIDVYEITNSIEATNIVTPNGDGKNDTWVILNMPPHSSNEVRIMDRSGRVVYYKKNYQNEWNGRLANGDLLAEGVYFYIIDFGAGLNPFKGTITLIRDKH